MPYGIPDATWNRLPSDDQAAIIAASKGQPTAASPLPTATAPTVAPPTQATPAPPPNLTAGSGAANAITSKVNESDDALVPPGVSAPTRPGVILIPATPSQPPTGAQANPTQPTPAIPAPSQDLGDDVLVPAGVSAPTRPGVTLIPATTAQPPTGAQANPAKPTGAAPTPPQDLSGDVLVPKGVAVPERSGVTLIPASLALPPTGAQANPTQPTSAKGSASARTLAAYVGPGTDVIPAYWTLASELGNFFQDPTDAVTSRAKIPGIPTEASAAIVKMKLQNDFDAWIKNHWQAPVRPTYIQTEEFLNLWKNTPADQRQADFFRRGYAIEKDLVAATGERRQRLLGAISSLTMVLALETTFNDYDPTYFRHGGSPGHP